MSAPNRSPQRCTQSDGQRLEWVLNECAHEEIDTQPAGEAQFKHIFFPTPHKPLGVKKNPWQSYPFGQRLLDGDFHDIISHAHGRYRGQ
jgi:hypothetical protein